MFILYVKKSGVFQAYQTFKDRRGYVSLVENAVALKASGTNEQQKNAAIVMKAFVLGKQYFLAEHGKTVLRALRNFDEVGLSNDIFESLTDALADDIEAFALAKEGEDINGYTQGKIAVTI